MDLQTLILDCLGCSTEPLLAAEIIKSVQARSPEKLKLKIINETLASLEAAGQVAIIKGLRKGCSQACVTTQKPLDLASTALAKVVAGLTTAIPIIKLKGALVKPLHPWFDEALGRLIVQGQAYYLTRGKTRLVQDHPPKPSEILPASALPQMKKILDQANRLRKAPLTVAEFFAWLDHTTSEPIHIVPRPMIKQPSLTADQLRAWHKADASSGSTTMIPIPTTFTRYCSWAKEMGEAADVDVFKRVLKGFYDAGHAILEPHERPHELPVHERELQVPMALGPPGFYWGLLD
jgi:hypothetical protein